MFINITVALLLAFSSRLYADSLLVMYDYVILKY